MHAKLRVLFTEIDGRIDACDKILGHCIVHRKITQAASIISIYHNDQLAVYILDELRIADPEEGIILPHLSQLIYFTCPHEISRARLCEQIIFEYFVVIFYKIPERRPLPAAIPGAIVNIFANEVRAISEGIASTQNDVGVHLIPVLGVSYAKCCGSGVGPLAGLGYSSFLTSPPKGTFRIENKIVTHRTRHIETYPRDVAPKKVKGHIGINRFQKELSLQKNPLLL